MHGIFYSSVTIELLHVQALVGSTIRFFKPQAIELDRYRFEYYFYT